MSTDLTVHQGGGEIVTRDYLNDRRELIRDQLSPGASDAELELLIETAASRGLDPLKRQIYGVMRRTRDGMRMSIQTGIDGFRLIAQRTGEYAGQVGPEWCARDGQWRDMWLEDEPPAAARVGVLRRGWQQPTYAIALWREYVQTDRDGKPSGQWKGMPALMLAKCAESLALRKAFPEDLSGIYTGEEMAQADTPGAAPPPPAAAPADDAERVVRERYVAVMAHGAPDGESELERKARWKAIGEALAAAGFSREDLADDAKHAAAVKVAERAAQEHAEQRTANANDAVRQFGGTGEVINEQQMKLLHAKGRELGLDHDQLHQIAADTFDGIESMTEIPAEGMDRMLEAMDAERTPA